MDRSVEIRVGIVIVVALILFVAGMIWITETRVQDRGYTFEAVFPTVGGLAAGDPVQVAGLERGRVKSISLRPSDVLVSIWLPSEIKVHSDATVSVENLGLMGEKFVSITLGEGPGTIAPGTVVEGRYSPGLTETMVQINELLTDLGGIVRGLRETVAADSALAMLLETIENTNRVSEEMTGLVARSRPDVESAVGDFAASARELRSIVEANREKVGRSLDGIERTTAGLDSLVVELKAASGSLRSIAARIEAGEGTLGRLSKDEALYTDLRRVLTGLDSLIVDIQKHPKKYLNLEIF